MSNKKEKVAVIILLLIGVLLRLRQYLSGRSLWADEAMLALNIVNRNFVELLKPLEYDQGAPIGFLFAEKLFNAILGRHELVLRFFPLLAGLASLWLFYLIAKQILNNSSLRGGEERRRSNPPVELEVASGWGLDMPLATNAQGYSTTSPRNDGVGFLLALALFVVNPALVYYSSEAKQYTVDVAAALGMLVLAYPVLQGQARKQDYIYLGLAGIVALWFSHPALFALAGIGVALVIQFLQNRDKSKLRMIFVMGLLWLVNFGLLYLINLRQLSRNDYLANYWELGFIPMPPWSDPGWFASYFRELIRFQFEITFLPSLVLILILAGWYLLFREHRPLALMFALTALFAFTASALRLYPVNGRLSLFLIPLGIILLGKVVEFIQKSFASNKLVATIAMTVVSGYLIFNPFIESVQNFISPKYYEHIRPTMQVLAESWKDGDALFVSAWAEPAFQFYAPFYGLEGIEIVSTEIEDYPDGEKLKSRIDPLIGQNRVWILFSHVYEQTGFNERDFLVAYLDEIGEQRREILKSGTSVYLFFYDLSK